MLSLGMIMPVLPKLVENFIGGDTARAAEIFGVFGTAWALMQFLFSPMLGALSDRLRPPAGDPDLQLRPRPRLHPDGARAEPLVAVRRPRHLRHHRGERRRPATPTSPTSRRRRSARRLSACSARPSAWASSSGRRSAALLGAIDPRLPFWVAAALSLANALYGVFVLPESLPPKTRAVRSGGAPIRSARCSCCARIRELIGLAASNFSRSLAHVVLPSVFGALCRLSLRLGRADGRPHARRRRRCAWWCRPA